MKTNLVQLVANIDPTEVREVQFSGRTHLVAPVVMAVETVMNGLLYPADELSKFVGAWNGRPVTLFHPKNGSGEFISANSPDVVESVHLGQIFNAAFDEKKLKAEIWVDVEKTNSIRPEIIDYLNGKKDRLEVSTGLWGDVIQVPGTFNNDSYSGIMSNIRPDHLALLPDGEGACNWGDGCGIRSNEMAGKDFFGGILQPYLKDDRSPIELVSLVRKRLHVHDGMTDYELRSSVQKAVDLLDNANFIHYVDAIIPEENKVIYFAEPRTNDGATREPAKMFRRSYIVDANGVSTLNDDVEEVRKKITYLKVVPTQGGNENMDKKAKIEALIACKRCRFTEKDREFLNGLNEEQLDLVSPPDNVVVKEEEGTSTPVVPTAETPAAVPEGNTAKVGKTAAEFLANSDMPAEIKDQISESLAVRAQMRVTMINEIVKNPKNMFSAERLQEMSTNDLKALAALAETPATPATNEGQTDSVLNFGMRLFGTNEPKPEANAKGPEPLVVQSLQEKFAARNK